MVFIGVYRAVYDYEPQADNEIAIQEKDLLCILDKGDDDWWKAKKRALSEDESEPEGLIPGNYVEPAKPISKGKAIYEYTRQTDEEISFPDEAELDVYDTSDKDWTLVGFNGEYGYAPAIYIESEEAPPPMPSRPQFHQQTPSPESEEEPALPPRRALADTPPESGDQSLAAKLAGIIQPKASSLKASSSRPARSPSPDVALPPRKQVQFTPEESDEEPPAPRLPRRPPTEERTVSASSARPTKHVSIREPEEPEGTDYTGVVASMPHNRVISATYDEEKSLQSPGGFHLYNIYEIVEVMGKNRKTPITLGINLAKGIISISSENSRDKEWTADKLTHYSMEGKHVFMELKRPSKSIDFHAGAKDTAAEIMSALGELAGAARAEGLREVFRASGASQKVGKILYDFTAVDGDDVSVSAGDEVIVLDDTKNDEWWMVRRKDNGTEGTVPSNYVEIIGSATSAASPTRSSTTKKNFVEQNRLEEERLTREASKSKKKEVRAERVGPGLHLPERGSSLSQDSDKRRSSQKGQQDNKSKRSHGPKSMPNTKKIRVWTDVSGSFKVEAEFIGLNDGKIHLHKNNGVKIAVPVTKMSLPDLEYVEKAAGSSIDEAFLASLSRRRAAKDASSGASVQKKVEYDWFDFFLHCGVSYQICERYAAAFRRDEMSEENMPDITPELLRTLGVKEGDILRIMKFLDQKFARGKDGTPTSGAGGLFSGPGGAILNNTTKKTRPTPANPARNSVDETAFKPKAVATNGKLTESPSEKKPDGGFDDNAWEPRKPKTTTTPATIIPAAPTTTAEKPAVSQAVPSGAIADLVNLNISSPPLQPTPAVLPQQQTSPSPTTSPQPQGATPSLFEQLARSPGTMLPNSQQSNTPPRQRPQPPIQTQTQNSIIAPPPQRAASAPQNPNQGSAFGPPPLQAQLTGYPNQANMHTQVAPLGQSLQDLNQQRAFQQQQQQRLALMPQITGYGPGSGFGQGVNGMPHTTGFPQFQQPQGMSFAPYQQPQQTGFPLTVQQQLFNGQHASASPFADPANSFQPQAMSMQQTFTPQQLQMQPTGINALLPPSLIPQQTGMGPGMGPNMIGSNGFGQVPPVPQIPSQPIAAPLIPQKTGPPPPVRFGLSSGPRKVAPKLPTKKANLAAATPQNPFGLN